MTNPHDLDWSARLDRRLISTRGGKRHILVDVSAPRRERPDGDRPPLNLGLVVDASGSMSGEPITAAIEAVKGVVDHLGADDRVTLVSFADDIIVHADAKPMDDDGRRLLHRIAERITVRGCTNLGAGWLEGCAKVADEMLRRPGTQNRVILLSDGHANCGITDPEQLGLHAAELRQRGLYTSTVGIGDGYSPLQLEIISEMGGGRLHDAPQGEDIVAVVLGELGEILATAADDVTLTVRHPRRMPVLAFGRFPTEVRDGEVTVSLGSLVSGGRRQVVLHVDVPRGNVGESYTVELVPTWKTPDEGSPVEGAPLTVTLALAPAVEVAAELPDVPTCQRIAYLWQKHILLESTLMNDEGRIDEATLYVREALRGFRDYCRDLPDTDDLVRQLEWHGREVRAPMCSDAKIGRVFEAKAVLKSASDYRINRRPRIRPE